VAVTTDDVRHIAALARLGLDDARIPTLVAELNGILEHMAVLQQVETKKVTAVGGVGAEGQPLRIDAGPPYPLARLRESFAPQTKDGFLLVPRLATHEDVDAALDAEAP
jgi:aspartyl-tRNA(Asn)/glutamyl-tRNA(Gln) amidotransferase subunit C